jgi:hypothetical protein
MNPDASMVLSVRSGDDGDLVSVVVELADEADREARAARASRGTKTVGRTGDAELELRTRHLLRWPGAPDLPTRPVRQSQGQPLKVDARSCGVGEPLGR